MRQVVSSGDDNTAGLICPVEQVVQRRKELRFRRAETKVDDTKTLFDRVFQTGQKRLSVAQSRRTKNP